MKKLIFVLVVMSTFFLGTIYPVEMIDLTISFAGVAKLELKMKFK